MSRHRDSALDAFIREHGGTIDEIHGDRSVTFGDDPLTTAYRKIAAHDDHQQQGYEAAAERVAAYGTVAVPLARPRGEGWFACQSHSVPGSWRVCQIDPENGEPVYCDCDWGQAHPATWCTHTAAAFGLASELWHDSLMLAPDNVDYSDLLRQSVDAVEAKKELCHAH